MPGEIKTASSNDEAVFCFTDGEAALRNYCCTGVSLG